ncbi:MAG: serine O-acetyltransferase [Herpetosiphon sp.]
MTNAIQTLLADMRAIRSRDPAARSWLEILLYPGLHAIIMHRLAHRLWTMGVPFVPRLFSQVSRGLTGIEIHPGASIGQSFFIDHGMSVVIGETTEIGNRVTLYQQVTLGGTGHQVGKRHPTLGNDIVVGVGASVLGAITVGDGARIGAGSVVLKDVPPHSTATGVPARVVQTRDPVTGTTRRLEHLPDPEGAMIQALRDKVIEMEARLMELEIESELHHAEHHTVTHAPMQTDVFSSLDNAEPYDGGPGWGI